MTRLLAFLSAPVLFPDLHPVAVWIGCTCVLVCVWAWWRADEMGSSETTIRAIEARDVLARMSERRWM